MKCRQFHVLHTLRGLLPEPLESRLRARLDGHVGTCASCGKTADYSRRVAALLRSTHEQQVASYRAPGPLPLRDARHQPTRFPLLAPVAAFAVIVAVGLWRGSNLRNAAIVPSPPRVNSQDVVRIPPVPKTPSPRIRPPQTMPHPQLALAQRTSAPVTHAEPDSVASPPLSDEQYLDGRSVPLALGWVGPDAGNAALHALEKKLPPMRDDFAQILLPPFAAADPKGAPMSDAVKAYEKDAKVVDSRLFKPMTLRLKAASLEDLAAELERQTGVSLQASRGVADEKVTAFVVDRPARDVMREVARLFHYIWARTGSEGAYRYQLIQDLKSQLTEEELRRNDVDQALLALHGKMGDFRPLLNQSPRELRDQAERATGDTRDRLIEASRMWGGMQAYQRLTPAQIRLLHSGEALHFTTQGSPLQFNPGGLSEDSLPKDWHESLTDSLGPGLTTFGEGVTPGSLTPWVGLRLDRSHLGEVALKYDASVMLPDGGGRGVEMTLASAKSPSVQKPDNASLNRKWRTSPTFTRRVSFSPDLSCPRSGPKAAAKPLEGPGWSEYREFQEPHASSADVWEAVHRATGLPVIADSYTRLIPATAVTVKDQPLFDALCRAGDVMGVRWQKDGDFLLARSTGYFWDKLKEVPNRQLMRWRQHREENGGLPLDDVLEMLRLSDYQLDATDMGMGAVHCWGIEEWGLAGEFGPRETRTGSRWARQFYRLAAGLSSAQVQRALTPSGLPASALSQVQQQAMARVEPSL